MGSILGPDRPVFPLSPSTRIAPQWQDGLVLAWVGARGIYTLFPSLRGSATDLERFQQSPYGTALQTKDSATNSGLTLPGFKGLEQTDNITLFALTAEPSVSSPTAAYSQRSPSAGNAVVDLALNRTNGGATSAASVSMYFRSTAASNRGVRFDGILDGQWHAIAIAHLTGSSYIASFDGGQRTAAATSAPTGTIITGDQVAVIGGRSGLTEGVLGPLAIVVAWARPWAQRDLDRITADPARLFAPRQIFVPVSAGGGGTEYTQTVVGSLSSGGYLIRQTGKKTVGIVDSFGVTIKHTAKSSGGSITNSGIATPSVGAEQSVTGTITLSGVLSDAVNYVRSYTSQIISSGSLNAAFSGLYLQALSGIIAASGTIKRHTTRLVQGTLTLSNTLLRRITRSLVSTLTGIGSVNAFKFVPTVGGLVNRGMRFMRRFIGRR